MIHCPDHQPKQHRDARPAWCPNCGLTKDGLVPHLPEIKRVMQPITFDEPPGYDEWIRERPPLERGHQGAQRT